MGGEMLDAAIQSDLLQVVEQLSPSLQRKVVQYAHSLTQAEPQGTPGDQLLEFAGILTPEEAKEMMDAIEDGCEQGPISLVRSMIGWIYEKPHMYARTVGEIDTALYCLHYLWAQSSGMRLSYEHIRSEIILAKGKGVAGLTDIERIQFTEAEGNDMLSAVLADWQEIDRRFEEVLEK